MEPTASEFRQVCQSYGVQLKSIQILGNNWLITAFIGNSYLWSQHHDLKMAMALLLAKRFHPRSRGAPR